MSVRNAEKYFKEKPMKKFEYLFLKLYYACLITAMLCMPTIIALFTFWQSLVSFINLSYTLAWIFMYFTTILIFIQALIFVGLYLLTDYSKWTKNAKIKIKEMRR